MWTQNGRAVFRWRFQESGLPKVMLSQLQPQQDVDSDGLPGIETHFVLMVLYGEHVGSIRVLGCIRFADDA